MHGLNSSIVGNLLIALPSVEEQDTLLTFLDRETPRSTRCGGTGKADRPAQGKAPGRDFPRRHQGPRPHGADEGSGIEWLGEVPAHWEERLWHELQ